MDKIRKKSKTMLALLLCALSVAALIPDVAPAYADNAEYAEESTETGSGLDESMQELDAENRLIVRTDAELGNLPAGTETEKVNGGYIISCDDTNSLDRALSMLEGMSSVESADQDGLMYICDNIVPETESGAAESEMTETEETLPEETETEPLSEAATETEAVSETETEEAEVHEFETEIIPENEPESETELTETEKKTVDWKELAESQGKVLTALIDTGSSEADGSISMISDSMEDENGHGSRMNRLIDSASEGKAFVLSIKAFGSDGSGRVSDVYAAVSYAMDCGADVISLSVSAKDTEDMNSIRELLRDAAGRGITVVCAAGNNDLDVKTFCPGNIPEVITTGACDGDGAILPESNFGMLVDYYVSAGSTSEAAALLSGYVCRYGANGVTAADRVFLPSQVKDPGMEGTVSVPEDEDFHISDTAITAGSKVKMTGGYNVGPAISASGSDFVAEYTFNIAGSLGYCGNIDASYGMYGSVAGVKSYAAGVYDFTDVGGKDLNYVVKQVYSENKNYTYGGKTIDGTLIRKILYYSDGAPGAAAFGWPAFEKGYADNSYSYSDYAQSADPNKGKYTRTNAYRKGAVSCACSYVWGQEMGLCEVNSSTHSGTYAIGKRYVDAVKKLPNAPASFEVYFAVMSDEYGVNTSMSFVQPILFWTAKHIGWIELTKVSDAPAAVSGNDAYSLAGAKYGIYSGSKLVETLTTDSKGYAKSGDLEAGSYTVKEISPSKGYEIDTKSYAVTVSADKTAKVTSTEKHKTYSLMIHKVMEDINGNDVSKKVSPEGIIFTVYDAKTGGKEIAKLTIGKADQNGEYYSGKASGLTNGTYYLEETSIPERLAKLGVVKKAGRTACTVSEGSAGDQGVVIADWSNEVPSGSIELRKEAKKSALYPEETSSLKGAEYGVYLGGDLAAKIITDEKGYGKAEGLTPGNYEIREIKVPAGYALDPKTYTIIVENKKTASVKVPEIPLRIKTQAKDVKSGTHYAAPEKKVTITDTVSYEGLTPGTLYKVTGTLMDKETGKALTVDGKEVTAQTEFTAKASEGTVDVTFTFNGASLAGKTTVVFEKLYEGEKELAVHAKIGDEDQTIRFVRIRTTAADSKTGSRNAFPGKTVTIKDTVSYTGLKEGTAYTVTGILMDKETGKELKVSGKTVEAENSFTADAAEGKIEMAFTFDASALKGKSVVVFESLKYEGKEIAVHADLSDEGQTIHFPEIGTTALDKKTQSHNALAEKEVVVTDTVAYKNLVPGKTYTVTGTLTDKESGKALMKDGKAVTAETSFTAEKAEGSVKLSFTIDASMLAGKSVVAFESLKEKEQEIAVHADISDEGQTIHFPEIRTTAVSEKSQSHNALAEKEAEITDTVAYKNLIPGKEYTVTGILMDKETGEALEVNGEQVTAEAVFTADQADGEIGLLFTFDASLLKGKSVVAFESLKEKDKEIAVHADLADEGQTVHFPEIGTTAVGGETQSHNALAEKEAVITDTVAYKNLIPGKEYTVTGILMDKETGKELEADGKQVTAETVFTAETAEGTIELVFTFDASALKGKSVVAFESLKEEDKEIAVHADLTDEGQTVHFPEIRTTAVGEKTQSHNALAEKEAVVTDMVAYTNLIPGKGYTVTGTLMDKESGKPLMKDGKAVTAETSFTAEKAEGSVKLSFMIDASMLAGRSVVAFESLKEEDHEIAVHADLEDEDQTVRFPEIRTTATGKDSGDHTVLVNEKAVIVDTIAYSNLIPGTEYTAAGTLMDKKTGKPVLEDGEAVTAQVSFKPEKAEGTAEVTFTFDASALTGHSLVVFEKVSENESGETIAVHEDLADEGQTVKVVSLPKTPKTGDDSDMILWTCAAIVAGILAVIVFSLGRKNREEDEEEDTKE